MEKTTFCIATYDDVEVLRDTINSLLSTTKGYNYDIIVIDDANKLTTELDDLPKVKLFKNPKRGGVGYSLDRAVELAETDIVFPMGCDIRFSGDWYPRFYEVVNNHPRSLVSTVTAGLNLERLQIVGKENHMFASHVIYHVSVANNNKPPLPFREFIECKWNAKPPADLGEIVQVGSILGAFYGCHKSWYQYIRGFYMHRTWGSLEPLVALRSYLYGGDCIIDTKTITGHIFKSASSSKPIHDLIYNKLLIAYTLLPTDKEKEVFDWANSLSHSAGALINFNKSKHILDILRTQKDLLGDEKVRELIKPTGILD